MIVRKPVKKLFPIGRALFLFSFLIFSSGLYAQTEETAEQKDISFIQNLFPDISSSDRASLKEGINSLGSEKASESAINRHESITKEKISKTRVDQIISRIENIKSKTEIFTRVTKMIEDDTGKVLKPEFRNITGHPPTGTSSYEIVKRGTDDEGFYDSKGNFYKGTGDNLLNYLKALQGLTGSSNKSGSKDSSGIQDLFMSNKYSSEQKDSLNLFEQRKPTEGQHGLRINKPSFDNLKNDSNSQKQGFNYFPIDSSGSSGSSGSGSSLFP